MEKIEDYHDPEVLRRLKWDEGLSFEEIGRRLYCSGTSVMYHMKKHDIPTRPNGQRIIVAPDGRKWTCKEIAKISGTKPDAIKQRVRAGWAFDDLFIPYGGRKRHARRLQRS